MRHLVILFLLPTLCFSQISLPEYSSNRDGGPITYGWGTIYSTSVSVGRLVEPSADGWYFSDSHQQSFPAPGGGEYWDEPGALMRFDSTGLKVWSAPIVANGTLQSLVELPSGNLVHQGYTYHWYDGLVSYDVTYFTPSGAVITAMPLPLMTFVLYPETMVNDPSAVQLTSGNLLGSFGNLVWTCNAAGTQYWDSCSFRFGSMGSMHGLYAAAGEHFYALCDSGLVEYDTMGVVHRHRPQARGKLLNGYHGDTLVWARDTWLFKADTAWTGVDSVTTLGSTSKIQLRADGIWVFGLNTVQHYDYALNLLLTVPFPATWFSPTEIQAADACMAGNKCVVAGLYQNACWKTFDLTGATFDPGYDVRLDTLEIDSVVANYMPGSTIGTLSYTMRAIVTNTGTVAIDSVGICGNHLCKVIKGLALAPGMTTTLYFGATSPPPPIDLADPYYARCVVFSPDEKLDANPSDNDYLLRVDIPVSTDEALADGLPVSLHPNPAQDEVSVSWPAGAPHGDCLIHVHDLAGRLVASHLLDAQDGQSIDISHLEAGCYLVTIHADGKPHRVRLVKH